MKLSKQDFSLLYEAALQAADKAARFIRSRAQGEIEVMRKEGGNTEASQVFTEVDLASENLLLESLLPTIESYQLGVLTEETEDDSSRHQTDYFWCIDPIDGTLPFIKGEPGYSVVIALVSRNGIPQLGVVHDVVADVVYHAVRGEGAFRDGEAVEPSGENPATHLSWFMDRSMLKHPRFDEWGQSLEKAALANGLDGVQRIDHAGAALNACWSASSLPAVYFKCPKKEDGGGSVWDFAASACFYEALGLPVSDMSGNPLNLNPEGSTFMNKTGVLYATSPEWVGIVKEIHGRLS